MRYIGTLYALLMILVGGLLPASRAQARTTLPVRVDTRVELLSIVFRLAGAEEYDMPNSQSPYAAEVAQYFAPFKDHPVIKLAAQLRQSNGIAFDAVMSYAVHLKNDRLEPKIPFPSMPPPLDGRWKPEDATRFLVALRQFVSDSKADRFFAAHRPFYQKAAARLNAELVKRPFLTWMDGFFGAKPSTKFTAIVGLLNGGGNYGVAVRYPDGKEEILPVIGVGAFDSAGLPVFDGDISSLIIHELCHSYTNPLVDRFGVQLLPASEKLFPYRSAMMKRQAYGSPRTMLYESLVRAVVVRFLRDTDTPQHATDQLMAEQANGFLWMPELVALLDNYVQQRDKYPTFQEFMPEVVGFFTHTADSIDELMARLPRIVSISPANNDQKVDPAIAELRIVFDRPMQTKSYALVGDPMQIPPSAITPEGPAKPRFSPDGKIFILPIKLKPRTTYTFEINSVYRTGFRSAEGQFLDPVKVTFTTAP